jgi:hypothetical protein
MSAVTLIPGRSDAPDTLDVRCQRRQEAFQRKYRGRITAPIGIIVQAQPSQRRQRLFPAGGSHDQQRAILPTPYRQTAIVHAVVELLQPHKRRGSRLCLCRVLDLRLRLPHQVILLRLLTPARLDRRLFGLLARHYGRFPRGLRLALTFSLLRMQGQMLFELSL